MSDLEKIIELIETNGNGTNDKPITVNDIYEYAKSLQLICPETKEVCEKQKTYYCNRLCERI